MRLLQTQITPFINNSLHVELRDQPYLFSPMHGRPCFHAHPELELVFILEGYGKRIIGNKVTQYKPGDMVLIGAGVPHLWLSDPAFYKLDSTLHARIIIMYINPAIFDPMLSLVKEFDGVKEVLQQSQQGINIFGKTKANISKKLILLASKTGFEKAIGLLEVLHLISISEDRNFIGKNIATEPKCQHSDRLIDVFKFVNDNLHEALSLKQVAEVACMEIQSFCRFFKNRTNMKFSQYLVDVRMTYACKILMELDKPISEIAYMCGYNSDSHFCKVFKDYTSLSPFQYKNNLKNRAD